MTQGQSRRHENRRTPSFGNLGLSATTLAAVADMEYGEPTPVQEKTIPLVLAGHDVMAAAQTGTGKTAAFMLPVLDRLPHANRHEGPLMLVVTPTRELAQQIAEVAASICARTQHRAVTVVGGVGYEPQKKALAAGCDILVATPGRLIDLINQGACSLGQVEVLVLDEADRMLDMGFLPDMKRIVARTPRNRQTLLFSATLGQDVLDNTGELVRDPRTVEIAPKGTTAQTVEQYVLGVSAEAKKRVLVEVLRREGASRVIVFVRGKHRADHLSRVLKRKKISCAPIHGDRSQNQRTRALAQFAAGEVDVLLATDVLARGIDIPEVSYVLNLDVPHEAEDYVHRIGRTGRAGQTGWALTLCSPDEYLDLRDIEQLTDKVIPTFPRAEGIDVGEDAPVLDPNRNPRDKLPGKKARKKIAKQNAEKRQAKAVAPVTPTPAPASASADKSEERTGRKRRNRASRQERPEQQEQPKQQGRHVRSGKQERPDRQGESASATRTRRRRRGPANAARGETATAPKSASATQRNPRAQKSAQTRKPSGSKGGRRRPGDRLGMRGSR